MKRGLFVLVLAALAGLALGQGAMVRVAHLSPDAPAVDVLVNGQRAITGLAFKEVTPFPPPRSGSRWCPRVRTPPWS